MDESVTKVESRSKLQDAWLFYLVITLILIAGLVTALNQAQILERPYILVSLILLVAAYVVLLWLSPLLIIKQKGMLTYFIIQLAITLVTSLLTPGAWLAIMLAMGTTGLGIAILWSQLRQVVVISLLGLLLAFFHMIYSWGWQALWTSIPSLLVIFIFVVVYVVVFTRQTQALQRVQSLLVELEQAHQQLQSYAERVEELTKNEERQRMARELHDTLIQGLAGLILQLEAVDSHLDEGHPAKAQQTAQTAMALARSTMVDARQVIQDLRPTVPDQVNIINAVARETEVFTSSTGLKTTFHHEKDVLDLPPDIAQNILRIVQESLVNVRRHADATHVNINLTLTDNMLRIVIEDDGKGFMLEQAMQKKSAFGLRGMQERAEQLGGELQVVSEPGTGTRIQLALESADD